MIAAMKWQQLAHTLKSFPWRTSARTVAARFREDRLGNTASSLTFTTVVSLVPLFTVVLAVFTAFPTFGKLQTSLQDWLAASLIPEAIAKQVMGYLAQFAGKASRLGLVGVAFLLVTALSLILTIDRTLNAIWRVPRQRPLAHRVLTYWALLTLGPLVLALSLALSSYLSSASRGLISAVPGFLNPLLSLAQLALLCGAAAALFRFVPNTQVRWAHAWAGGIFVGLALELCKAGLAAYLRAVPTYSAVYGAFASVPILLLWIYLAWLLVLFGAVIAAYLPSFLTGQARRAGTPGWQFQLALEVLAYLHQHQQQRQADQGAGVQAQDLALALHVDPLELEPALQALLSLDWVGKLADGRLVLLAEPARTPVLPLAHTLLLAPSAAATVLGERGFSRSTLVAQLL